MLRVTTLYAASAVASAAYYTRYLAEPSRRGPAAVGPAGGRARPGRRVEADNLQRLLEGRDPADGTPLGSGSWSTARRPIGGW